ncbi:MAG: radical SAM protein [Candidatus Thermoplasmatota archaeon]|nr:radical SAM protein [Candidatus Thermoplasmatota archaeon]
MRPREAFIAVTYACNARCQMCNIWKNPSKSLLPVAEYLKLPSSLRTINITGGEPFLRKDLVEVVKAIDSVVPRARFVFSTNGMLTDTIVSEMEEIRRFHPNLGAGVSIDGIDGTHDSIRGVPGIFDRAVSTVEKLREKGFEDLRIAMTLIEGNYSEVGRVLDLSRRLGVEFTMTLAHDSDVYFKKSDNVSSKLLDGVRAELPVIVDRQLRSRAVKDWFRACHTAGIMDAEHRSKFTRRCEAGRLYFFMSPEGDVYPCNVLDFKIGNLASVRRWDDLFTPEVRERTDRIVAACKKDCWMICNARSLMIAHPLRTGAWVTRNKIRAHLK